MEIDIKQLMHDSINAKSLPPDAIPDLDLYMDQIIALMNTHLGTEGEKEPLTRTMIHNYSKAGLITPLKGKKYSKEQILQMLAIYSLKNTLSIAQIKRVLYGTMQSGIDADGLAQCFETHLARRDHINQQLVQTVDSIIQKNDIPLDTTADILSLLLTLTDVTDSLRNLAAALTQLCFPEPPDKKTEKAERKQKNKAQT